jgi:hypothetical protein
VGTRWALSPLALSAEAIVNFRAPQILNQVQHDSGLRLREGNYSFIRDATGIIAALGRPAYRMSDQSDCSLSLSKFSTGTSK